MAGWGRGLLIWPGGDGEGSVVWQGGDGEGSMVWWGGDGEGSVAWRGGDRGLCVVAGWGQGAGLRGGRQHEPWLCASLSCLHREHLGNAACGSYLARRRHLMLLHRRTNCLCALTALQRGLCMQLWRVVIDVLLVS